MFFYFLKIIFNISTSKWSKNIKNINFKQKKLIFLKTRIGPRFQTCSKPGAQASPLSSSTSLHFFSNLE